MRKLRIAYMERPGVGVLANSPIKDLDNRQPIPDTRVKTQTDDSALNLPKPISCH